jgi:hypothetical protein
VDQAAQRRAAAPARAGAHIGHRLVLVCALLLAAAGCTRTYLKDFAIESADRAYAPRAQYEDVRDYLRLRGLRTVIETNDFLEVEIEAGDRLQVRMLPAQTVELTLVRRTREEDFTPAELRAFRDNLERVLRSRSGRQVTIRLSGERTVPITNLQ